MKKLFKVESGFPSWHQSKRGHSYSGSIIFRKTQAGLSRYLAKIGKGQPFKVTESTVCIFRMASGNYSGAKPEVIALFPEIAATMNPNECLSYCHYGQHGAAMASGHGWRLATEEEYAPLKKELESYLGANSYLLDVKTRSCPAYTAKRRESLKA